MPNAAIIGTGHHVPARVVTNQDLTQWMDTSDAWIRERSGIRERRWLEVGPDGYTLETGVEMGAKAARMAIEAAGVEPTDIDQIIYATLNPDTFFPGNGVYIEDLLGAPIEGGLYPQEYQAVQWNGKKPVERIIKERKLKGQPREYFVSYRGWPPKFNEWTRTKPVI